jgi:hypothetical protein
VRISDKKQELEIVKEYYEDILWDKEAVQKLQNLNKCIEDLRSVMIPLDISKERIKNTMQQLNIAKSCGNDLLFPALFKNPKIQDHVIDFIDSFFN